jgi:hypothetical protein
MTPYYVPKRLHDRETLWNEVERVEKNKRAQLAYSFNIALQNELTIGENIELARQFCMEQFVSRGMIVDMAVHEGDSEDPVIPDNPHFHVIIPIRPVTEDGSWGSKQKREYLLDSDGNRVRDKNGNYVFNAVSTTGWNSPELLAKWREAWADTVNDKFRANGLAARVDHRSYAEQGIDLIPTVHEGYEVRAMEKKGIRTVIGEINRLIKRINESLISLKESIKWHKTFQEEVSEELYKRRNPSVLESLQAYYDKRNKVADTYAYGREKARHTNLKEFSSALVYLEHQNIVSIEDLNDRLKELSGVVGDYRKEISARRNRIAELTKLLDYDKRMKKNQPVIDKLNKMMFKWQKENFKKEHKKEISEYQMCKRVLKQHRNENGKLPLAKWKREREELIELNEEADKDKLPFSEELKKLRKVEKCIDIMRNDSEQTGNEQTDTAGTERSEKENKRHSIRDRLDRKKQERDRRDYEKSKSTRKSSIEL